MEDNKNLKRFDYLTLATEYRKKYEKMSDSELSEVLFKKEYECDINAFELNYGLNFNSLMLSFMATIIAIFSIIFTLLSTTGLVSNIILVAIALIAITLFLFLLYRLINDKKAENRKGLKENHILKLELRCIKDEIEKRKPLRKR